MTVTFYLRPEVEAGLEVLALANGMPMEAYLLTLLEQAALPNQPAMLPAEQLNRNEAVRKMLAFGDTGPGEPMTPAPPGILRIPIEREGIVLSDPASDTRWNWWHKIEHALRLR